MNNIRVVVVVSHDPSDLYFANQLMRRLNVVGMLLENQQHTPENSSIIIKALKIIYKPHIFIKKSYGAILKRTRRKYAVYNRPENAVNFGAQGQRIMATENCKILHATGINNINAPEYIEWIKNIEPDIIAVCGASIFKENILQIPGKGTLNLHGGLSQRYRGLFTTDWAIYNEEPQYIGATIHYISSGIDDGDVIYQGRPEVTLKDNPNSLYVKVVKLGVDMMEQAIKDIEKGTVRSTPLAEKGTLYLKEMFTPKLRGVTWRKIQQSVIPSYMENKQVIDRCVLDRMINDFSNVSETD